MTLEVMGMNYIEFLDALDDLKRFVPPHTDAGEALEFMVVFVTIDHQEEAKKLLNEMPEPSNNSL